MVDIHSHILWGLDDGAKTLDESLAMGRSAGEHGTTDIVASPHANHYYPFQTSLITERLDELNAVCSGTIKVHYGCDFHLHFENIEDALKNPERYTINHLRYLMVEFADLTIPPNIHDIFQRLQQTGIIPVITHPERNPILQRHPSMMDPWIEGGCHLQLTAQSLTGHFGRTAKQVAWRLLASGHAQFVASDAHDLHHRPPNLEPAYAEVASRLGDQAALRLFVENPAAVLKGDYLPLPAPEIERYKTSGWRRFFNP